MNTQTVINETISTNNPTKCFNILLLTNRDSDNVGDQVIEICDIGLIKTVMKNLNIQTSDYKLRSSAAGIITKKYLDTRDPAYIINAEQKIMDADLIIFGGAPLFNYKYQNFYEKTAITLELAQKHNKPVIFSAIGIESYDEHNRKCKRLKKALNFECVQQITTRDNFEYLKKFRADKRITIDKVADPAVFSSKILEKSISPKNTQKKTIGIFVLRANGFVDNGVKFTKDDAIKLWKDIIQDLEAKGYDYQLLTSGNFGDEALLTRLLTQHGIPLNKCVFNMNNPEKLIEKISSYDAVISTRLHPSIISYSLKVPSVGIVWNKKVPQFYDNIGYSDRTFETTNITSTAVIEKLEQAMNEGIEQEEDFLMSIYNSLFNSIKKVIYPEDLSLKPYTYDELMTNMVVFKGTSPKEIEEKLRRKSKRTYESYNALFDKNVELKNTVRKLKEDILKLEINALTKEVLVKPSDSIKDFKYQLRYHSGAAKSNISCFHDDSYCVDDLPSGAIEYYKKNTKVSNTKPQIFDSNGFSRINYSFKSWILRVKVDETWLWYMNDGTLQPENKDDPNFSRKKKRFSKASYIPYLPVDSVDVAVAEAIWEPNSSNKFIRSIKRALRY